MIHYWDEEDKKSLETAETLHDLLNTALCVLKKMPQPIVEVCGPMSTGGAGDLTANLKRFKNAVDVLFESGVTVFDQIPFQDAMMRITSHDAAVNYNTDLLDIFYNGIFSSGHIKKAYFLPEWQSSKGARWEREFLQALPIEIVEYPEDLFSKVLERE